MTSERWSQLKAIFGAALDLPPAERDAYLDAACAGDAELRSEVAGLLHEHEQAGALTSPLRNTSLVGQTVAHYRILAPLGRGGMGVVYKGEDLVLGRQVALKFVAPEVSHVPESRARFLREAQAAAAVIHPNLCTLLEVEEHQGQMFLVMNFVDGRTLRDHLAAGALPVDEALRIAADTAAGLQALHGKGIIHRDIKSSNIMLQADGTAVITDFGIAAVEGQERITRTGGELGTVAYMAPELLAGGRPDPRSDLWSLGVVLFEMLAGQMPFRADNQAALAAAIQNLPHLRLGSLREGIPSPVEKIVDQLLAKDPALRFQNAAALQTALAHAATATGSAANPAPAAAEKPGQPRRMTAGRLLKYAVLLFILWRVAAVIRVKHSDPPAAAMSVAPETSYPGLEDSPSFSPDGRQIAFSWRDGESGTNSVCIKMIAEQDKVCLGTGEEPVWSPDGKWIAFLRQAGSASYDIVLASPLGGQERVLSRLTPAKSVSNIFRMAWMPDSRALIITDTEHSADGGPGQESAMMRQSLWSLSIDTLQRTRLTTPPDDVQGDRAPAVSPDGKWLAFVRQDHMSGQIAVVRLSASGTEGRPRRISLQDRFVGNLVWSKAGDEIIFAASNALAESDFHLWRIPFDEDETGDVDETPRNIELATGSTFSPALSPDGGTLLFTSYQSDQNIYRIDRDDLHSPWKAPVKFTEISSTRDDAYPSLSPDGRRLSFVSSRSGRFDLWLTNSDGSNPRQLTQSGTISGTSAWSPDGKLIAYDLNVSGSWDAYVISPEGGVPRPLTSQKYNETSVTWSRDGRYLYINSTQSGDMELWRQPLAGGPPEQMTRHGGMFGFETVDGKSLIYTRHHHDGGPLLRTELGKETVEVLAENVYPLCFYVTARGVYYFRKSADDARQDSLYFYDFPSRRNELIFTSPRQAASSITVSPDERTVLFTLRDQVASDILRIENFQ